MTEGTSPAGPPRVTVVVPCYNERPFIEACLDSILATRYPAGLLEVLVVDGMSDDGTRDVIRRYERLAPALHLLDNPKRITPAALNVGIARATGDVIVRMDVHAEFPPDYLPELVGWLERSGADNVGGVAETRPAGRGPVARAIAMALSHPFGVGNSRFRIGAPEPRWVDTVPFGCYPRRVFERIGPFDEDLIRNQDDELNARLVRSGGRILLVPSIRFRYFARSSLRKLWRMYRQYGFFKPLAIRKLGAVPTVRQLVPPLFVGGLLALGLAAVLAPPARWALAAALGVYGGLTVAASVAAVLRRGDPAALLLPLVFPVVHVAYGWGFLRGVVPAMLRRAPAERAARVPVSR